VVAEESAEQSNPEPTSEEPEPKVEAEPTTEIVTAVEEIVTAVKEICSVVAEETEATQDDSMEDISKKEHHPELPEIQPDVETPTDVTELQTAEVEVTEPQAVSDVPPQVEALPSVCEESCVIDESCIEPCIEPVVDSSTPSEAPGITVNKKSQLTRGLSSDEYTQLLFNLQGAFTNILGDLSAFCIQSMNVNVASGDSNVKLMIDFTLCANEEAKGE